MSDEWKKKHKTSGGDSCHRPHMVHWLDGEGALGLQPGWLDSLIYSIMMARELDQ